MSFLEGIQAACLSSLPVQYPDIKSGNIVAAYFGNWDVYGANHYQIDRIEAIADKITHLIYGFMKPDEFTGTCKPHDIWADVGAYEGFQTSIGGNFAKLIALKKKFPHLKVLLSIGGGTYNKQFIVIASDREKLVKFAQSCVDLLDFYDHPFLMDDQYKRVNHLTYDQLFDGIDIDWEFESNSVTPELSQAYTFFIQEIRRLLDIRDQQRENRSLYTVALQVNPTIYHNLELKKLSSVVDWFNVMAYDFYGPWSPKVGLNAPLCNNSAQVYSVDGALDRIMQVGVAPDRMVLGLPLYGYVYENVTSLNMPVSKSYKTKSMSYHLIVSTYLATGICKKIWDTARKSSYLISEKNKIFISFDDKQSLTVKAQLARNKRLKGVVVWRLSGDDLQHSLIDAIADIIM